MNEIKMEIILPLKIKSISRSLKFPIILLYEKDISAKIEKFSITEKEWFFDITNIRKGGLEYDSVKNSFDILNCQECITTKYKLVVKGITESHHLLQEIQWQVEFAFKIILGCDFPIFKIKSNNWFNNSTVQNRKDFIFQRNNELIDEKIIKRLKKLISILVKKNNEDKEKKELLKFFLDSAMSRMFGLGISGALYVSILESIFVPEKDAEIGYRFAMRLSKIRGKGLEYKNVVKKMYNNRSVVFHGGKNKFTEDDLKFLKEEVSWAIEEYLLNPNSFSPDNFDQILLH
ncbi:MAG: hypothetical protein PHN19_03010 [Patescibacteria group bacterium]|nr:hypothetical protein [Patescibacteria group bacterium]